MAEVQVIDEQGKQLGTMVIDKALTLAKEADLDRQEKKNAGPKKAKVEQKTVRVGFKTGMHDLQFKANQVGEFLNEGHIVKVELTLRGREKGLAEMGKQKLLQFLTHIKVEHAIQESPKRGPYGWIVTIIKKK